MNAARAKKMQGLTRERVLLDTDGIREAVRRLADSVVKQWPSADHVLLIGIRTGGVVLAERLQAALSERWSAPVPLGVMDITLYRDDVFEGLARPELGPTELPGGLEGKRVLLVDDVLFTGRTIRSALVELMDYGRPAHVALAVLVDRGHRELPIHADHVGLQVQTARDQSVQVDFEQEQVVLCRKEAP